MQPTETIQPTSENVSQEQYTNKSLIRELFEFIWAKKLWWLLPFLIIMLLVGILIVAGQNSALSAFIYAMF